MFAVFGRRVSRKELVPTPLAERWRQLRPKSAGRIQALGIAVRSPEKHSGGQRLLKKVFESSLPACASQLTTKEAAVPILPRFFPIHPHTPPPIDTPSIDQDALVSSTESGAPIVAPRSPLLYHSSCRSRVALQDTHHPIQARTEKGRQERAKYGSSSPNITATICAQPGIQSQRQGRCAASPGFQTARDGPLVRRHERWPDLPRDDAETPSQARL